MIVITPVMSDIERHTNLHHSTCQQRCVVTRVQEEKKDKRIGMRPPETAGQATVSLIHSCRTSPCPFAALKKTSSNAALRLFFSDLG